MAYKILTGDALTHLRTLKDQTINTCITSPPYFGLRDYGNANQIGLEASPTVYVEKLVEVFREVRRVLRDDGTLWLNLGDSYAGSGKGGNPGHSEHIKQKTNAGSLTVRDRIQGADGLDAKQLLGIPWRVALALQADGWYLRQDIIWHKPNPMPESVRDRCTKAHEYLFLLSKSSVYYFDSAAMQEPAIYANSGRTSAKKEDLAPDRKRNGDDGNAESFRAIRETRNRRSVWTVPTKPFREAHFATFPPDLIRPCVLAGSLIGGVVLDPFAGACTTGVVATEHGRHFVGIELNPEYVEMSHRRLAGTKPLPPALPPVATTPPLPA